MLKQASGEMKKEDSQSDWLAKLISKKNQDLHERF